MSDAKKKAFLVGINKYIFSYGADLRGCVNDVHNMRDVLMNVYGFSDADITLLLDAEATKAGITSGIEALLAGAAPGDVLYIHYSGHGSNVPDDNGDEADNRDEIFCPTDLNWLDPLRDDWMREQFDKLPQGVNLTIVTDCCHSGSITRLLQPPDAPVINRYLPCPLDMFAIESGRDLAGKSRSLRAVARAANKPTKNVATVDIFETLITGCTSTQTSADAYINGSYNGALTYYLADVIRSAGGELSCRDLHRRVIRKLRGRYTQTPQLEGRSEALDRLFLAPLT